MTNIDDFEKWYGLVAINKDYANTWYSSNKKLLESYQHLEIYHQNYLKYTERLNNGG